MKKVLIIEDDAIMAMIYKNRLLKDGFQVEVAVDGQAGFYRTHEILPDAILLDVMLPQMDGLMILRKIRAQKKFQKTPIIVYSSTDTSDLMEQAMEAGATQFFNKTEASPIRVCEALVLALVPKPAANTTPQARVTGSIPDENDEIFRDEILREYFKDPKNSLKKISEVAHCVSKTSKEEQRLIELLEIHLDICQLSAKAQLSGLTEIAQTSATMEAALQDRIKKRRS